MLDLQYPLTNLVGAEYNPRKINDAEFKLLRQSIKELGVVKPIIARGTKIVAGHQRTKALRAEGVDVGPVYLLSTDTNVYDEVRFNQLHNGTDLDCGEEDCRVSGRLRDGYQQVDWKRISGNMRSPLANVRNEISEMVQRYGPWGGAVALRDGTVIHAAQYALAMILTRQPLTLYVLKPEQEEAARKYLGASYGIYSYDHLDKTTYIQHRAQMFRLRANPTHQNKKRQGGFQSVMYENVVIPYLENFARSQIRIIDFGSGEGDYAKRLRAEGFQVDEVEFFRKAPGSRTSLAVGWTNKRIDEMCAFLKTGSRYDIVVCDTVMNSVDSKEAEDAVMCMLNLLAKPGGAIFYSGRRRSTAEKDMAMTKVTDHIGRHRSYTYFMDPDGFTANFRDGHWFYQKYHTDEQAEALATDRGMTIETHENHTPDYFQIRARKTKELPKAKAVAAVKFEFSLPLPEGRRYERADDVLAALQLKEKPRAKRV